MFEHFYKVCLLVDGVTIIIILILLIYEYSSWMFMNILPECLWIFFLNVYEYSSWMFMNILPEYLWIFFLNVYEYSSWMFMNILPECLWIFFLNVYEYSSWMFIESASRFWMFTGTGRLHYHLLCRQVWGLFIVCRNPLKCTLVYM